MAEIQTITYSNYLFFNGAKLAFKKQMLFNIDNTPFLIQFKKGYWLINGKQLTPLAAKKLTVKEEVTIDISNLQWYQQEQLKECFNLN